MFTASGFALSRLIECMHSASTFIEALFGQSVQMEGGHSCKECITDLRLKTMSNIPDGFKLACEGCSEDAADCAECESPMCWQCGDIYCSDNYAYCSDTCFANAGYFYCEEGETHSSEDVSPGVCYECEASFCSDCNDFVHCSVCAEDFCDDTCSQSEDHECHGAAEEVSTTHNVHTKMVDDKEKCFCNDSNHVGLGHLPGGIHCRIYG